MAGRGPIHPLASRPRSDAQQIIDLAKSCIVCNSCTRQAPAQWHFTAGRVSLNVGRCIEDSATVRLVLGLRDDLQHGSLLDRLHAQSLAQESDIRAHFAEQGSASVVGTRAE